MARKVSRLKTSTVGLVIASTIAGGVLGLSFGREKINVPSYKATRVIDGDTFETEEKQWIRVSGIDAPEKGLCGSEQSKKALEKIVLGKDLYIKVVYHDSTRLMGLVYNKDGLVSTQMLKTGWVELNDRDNLDLPQLGEAGEYARSKKLGLYSSICTQETNPKNKECNIKGNNAQNNIPTYHYPGCNSYQLTKVELHHNDEWFCTEKDAEKAGYVRAKTCP